MTVHTPPEIRLRNAESALRKSQERHQLALLAGGLGSWELDLRTMVLEASDGCKTNFGLSAEDELPYSRLMELMVPEDPPGMQASVAQALETGGDYQAEYRIRRPDGQIAWIAAYGRPFFAADGTPDVMLGTTQDITRRKHAEAEREQLLEETRIARDQAEGAVRLRDAFLSSTIHDLRTPLTAMRGRVQLLQRQLTKMDLADEDRQRILENLAHLEGGTSRLESLLSELQDVAFLQIGRPLELRCAPADLTAILQTSIDQIGHQSNTHTVCFDADQEQVTADVDATRIERVVDNLLSNAVKYSPEGGTVTVRLHEEGEWIVLAVRDEGVGIPAGELEHIFERYRRGTNVTTKFEGMGIGLSGAKIIVEQHGGTLTVESQEGKGSTFTVRLPAPS